MEMLTKADVIRETGLSRTAVQMAIARGELPAEVGSLPPNGRLGYLIRADDFRHWWSGRVRPARIPWSDADLCALVELAGSCSDAQLARYLGRSRQSTVQRLFKARRAGLLGLRRRGGSVSSVPFLIPAGMPLVAKTCARCGELRDVRFYARKRVKGSSFRWSAWCRLCIRARSAAPRDRTREREMQAATVRLATRSNFRYTAAEVAVVMDRGKSDFEVAVELGRTLQGVMHKRHDLGFYGGPRKIELPDERWVIEFLERHREQQQEFIRLGVPDDGWNSVA